MAGGRRHYIRFWQPLESVIMPYFMQQERTNKQVESIREVIGWTRDHDAAPPDWLEDIPNLSVSGETKIDDLRWGSGLEKLKEDLSDAGFTDDQVSKIRTTLLGLEQDIKYFYHWGQVTVSTLRQLDEDDLAFILRSKTDASIVKKLFG